MVRQQGKTLLDAITRLYDEFGWYKTTCSASPLRGERAAYTPCKKMMKSLRNDPPKAIPALRWSALVDYSAEGTGPAQGRRAGVSAGRGGSSWCALRAPAEDQAVYLSAAGESEATRDASTRRWAAGQALF